MSQENVEVVREYIEALAPHVVLVLHPEFAPSLFAAAHEGALYGIEAIAAYTRDLLDAWPDYTMEAEEIVVAGDGVLVGVCHRGVGRSSGVPTEGRYFTLWSFRGSKVIRIESFGERAEALEAAGLRE
jgi:ketosteroid isomerase-like protein